MSDMSVEQLRAIKHTLLQGQANLTWTELKQAFLHLFNYYDNQEKQLTEANLALGNAVLDDLDSNIL